MTDRRCKVCGESESSSPWEGTHKYGPTTHDFELEQTDRKGFGWLDENPSDWPEQDVPAEGPSDDKV